MKNKLKKKTSTDNAMAIYSDDDFDPELAECVVWSFNQQEQQQLSILSRDDSIWQRVYY